MDSNGTWLALGTAAAIAAASAVRRRGSRGELVSLAQRWTRKDEPRFQVYTVVAEPDSDWMIEAGFADTEAARRHRDEILKTWGRKLKIVDRKALVFHGEDPREARHWMKGAPQTVPPGTELTPLDAAKVAIHNAYWWVYGHPFRDMDEAVLYPADTKGAWAPKAEVVILREYGLPDDFAWWESVDTELERVGARLYNESINPGVYALYPIPAPARPTLLHPSPPVRPRGSGATRKVPPPLPASMEMRHTSTFSFRIRDQGWTHRGPADMARVLDTDGGWFWGSYIEGPDGEEHALGLWVDAKFRVGEVYGTLVLATQTLLPHRRARSLVRARLHRRIRDGFGGSYDTHDPTDWTPPLFTDDIDVFARIASPAVGSPRRES